MTIDTQRMNTRHSAEFIANMVAKNPTVKVSDAIRLCPARLSFPHLDKPSSSAEGSTLKYSAGLLLPGGKELIAPFTELVDEISKTAFPKNPKRINIKCFLDQDQGNNVSIEEGGQNAMGKTLAGFVPGNVMFTPKSLKRPQLWTVKQGKATLFTGADVEEEFYAGAWVIAVIKPYAYGYDPSKASKQGGNPGMTCELQSVCKILDDESYAGGSIVDPNLAFGSVEITNELDLSSFM